MTYPSDNLVCARLRADYDEFDLAANAKFDAHALECAGCRDWHQQVTSLSDLAAAMPQFDVSEALTQRIMTAVEADRRAAVMSKKDLTLIVPVAVVAAAALVTVAPCESLDGIVSWTLGLGLLALMKMLVTSPVQSANQVTG